MPRTPTSQPGIDEHGSADPSMCPQLPTDSGQIAHKLSQQRVAAADVRRFHLPGAGAQRRAAISALTREHLELLWHNGTQGRNPQGLALAAVGSLARNESGPLSDLDLVLVHDGRYDAEHISALADQLWYPLWDAGLRLDHCARSLTECREVAAEDIAAAAGLLDIVTICGDQTLVAGVRTSVARDWRANARRRLPEVLAGVNERHERFGDLPDLIEPDLKESRGGLRDMALLRALVAAWLTDRPHGQLDQAYSTLLDVRDALQVVTGRSRDRLVRNDQDGVAALLGYEDADRLLTAVCDAGRVVANASECTIRRAGQSHRARTLRTGPRTPSMTPLGNGLFVSDGEVVLGPRTQAAKDPLVLMRAAEAAARSSLPLAPTTLAHLVATAEPVPHPWPQAARETFAELLVAGSGLWNVWESLTLANVIEAWIPQWTPIRSRPQHNPVHTHTVDRHSVATVIAASSLVEHVRQPEALLLAALLHDLGKADGGADHPRTGVSPARDWLTGVGYEPDLIDVVCLLVAQHLTLVDLATRRDPEDPRTIEDLLDAVNHDRDTLDLLTMLTQADAQAAGPGAWTSWRATLVQQLSDRARAQLSATGKSPAVASTPTPETAPCLAAPTAHMGAAAAVTGALVEVEGHGDDQVISIVAPDRVGLFADCAGMLAVSGLSVRRATVSTDAGVAVNRWHVTSRTGAKADARFLERSLRRLAHGDSTPLMPLRRMATPAPGSSSSLASGVVSRALLVPGAADEATVLELRAPDRPGLLHDVGRCVAGLGLCVRSAYVTTSCRQALDTLYLTEPDGAYLSPARVASVIAALITAGDATGSP